MIAFSASDIVFADSGMYCGRRLISLGDSSHKVRKLCGEPVDMQQRTEVRSLSTRTPYLRQRHPYAQRQPDFVGTRVIEITIEEWFYDFGSARLSRQLIFEQGRLVRVRTEGYGE
ncbi:MAG: DUF2845 domain-containing protein [Pseudomonadota bacterium]